MDHKRLIDELTQGREFAKQLQLHLNAPSSSHETQEILIHNILDSYDKSLSLLTARRVNTNGSNGDSHLHVGMGITRYESSFPSFSESPRSVDSEREFKDPDHKDFAAKRKSNGNMEKWKHQVEVRTEIGVQEALDDGYSWRKYGQKDILGAKHPRGYYRCTYRQVEGCFATKHIQRSNEDPNIFNVTYRGKHTCNLCLQTISPPPSPPRQIQQPPQQNQLPQSPETLLNFQTGLEVITENQDAPSFLFPSASNNNFIFPTLANTVDGTMSPSFISPTTSGSNYFTISEPRPNVVGRSSSVVVTESELNNIVSTATSSTSSANVDVGFPFGELEFGNNFNFDNSIFFD